MPCLCIIVQGGLISDPNHYVVEFSVPEVKSIVEVLKAFPVRKLIKNYHEDMQSDCSQLLNFLQETGAKIVKVNPPQIKVYNHYVECCCGEDEREELLSRLKEIRGVTNVTLEPESIGIII